MPAIFEPIGAVDTDGLVVNQQAAVVNQQAADDNLQKEKKKSKVNILDNDQVKI